MEALELLRTLQARGLTVEPVGDRLLVSPTDRLTDALRAAIQAHKLVLLEVLRLPLDLLENRARLGTRLQERIRRMADWWRYSKDELAVALDATARDPQAWLELVEGDERWRHKHPERRPTVPAGHG